MAQSQWAALYPDGFAPHFETTHTWAQRLACFTPGPYDISFSAARDALTARDLLESARMALPRDAARDAFTPLLVQAALQVAPLAAAVPSRQRADWGRWAAEAVPAPSDGWLAHENALMRLALRWAAASDYATDVLFAARTLEQTDALIAFHGAQADELTGSLILWIYCLRWQVKPLLPKAASEANLMSILCAATAYIPSLSAKLLCALTILKRKCGSCFKVSYCGIM